MRRIDKATVEALQGRAPGACRTDHDDLLAKLKGGQIFGNFSEPQREAMWPKVCSASRTRLIPSLFAFFEDRKFLACAAECMKKIVDTGPRDTIAGRLEDMFTDVNQQSDRCVIQVSNGSFGTIAGDAALRLDLGMRQLWLAAFRVYQDLPTDAQKKDRLAKARMKPDESTLHDLAALALRLGFESDKVRKILQASPDRVIAENALLAARKPGRFQYVNREQRIQQVVDVFATAVPMSDAETSEHADTSVRAQPPNRYGIPHDLDHGRDKARLFLPKLDEAAELDQTEPHSLFIRRSVYLAYFGQPPPTQGCIADRETTNRDVSMTDQTSQPLEISDHVELSRALITRALDLELDAPQNDSHRADDHSSTLHQLRRNIENERTKLDQLQALLAAEQARIEEKETLLELLATQEEEKHAKLRQLEEMQQEQQGKLDRLTQRVRDEERQRTEMALALRDDPLPEAEETGEDERLRTESQQVPLGMNVASRRANRRTRFSFGRLLEDAPPAPATGVAGAEDRDLLPGTTRIEFKLLEQSGMLKVVDTLDVDPANPSPVRRLAGKYIRKNFCLYDMHRNNLAPKNCFEKATMGGANTIVLRDVSQAGTAVRKVRLVGIEEEQTRRTNRRKGLLEG